MKWRIKWSRAIGRQVTRPTTTGDMPPPTDLSLVGPVLVGLLFITLVLSKCNRLQKSNRMQHRIYMVFSLSPLCLPLNWLQLEEEEEVGTTDRTTNGTFGAGDVDVLLWQAEESCWQPKRGKLACSQVLASSDRAAETNRRLRSATINHRTLMMLTNGCAYCARAWNDARDSQRKEKQCTVNWMNDLMNECELCMCVANRHAQVFHWDRRSDDHGTEN